MDSFVWGPVVRIAQAFFAAAPTVVVGLLVAAIFERILGRENTLRLFGGRSWRQVPQAWLLGMLLPVCSLGVIPVMLQMRKSSISGGTILAFGLTAPLFNPISVLYGLTLSDPLTLFVFCLGSLTIVTVIGIFWDWRFPNNWIEPELLPPTPYGIQRIMAVGLSMCQQATGPSARYIIIGLIGVGLLAAILPAGLLQHSANNKDLTAPLTMTGVAALAYVTPMTAIVQVASMFQHGNSIGAAFTLLVMGTGLNLGLIAWSVVDVGWKRTLSWLWLLIFIVLVISYSINGPLHPKGVQAADHTHAFDGYCNPFSWDATEVLQTVKRHISDAMSVDSLVAVIFWGILVVVGASMRWLDPSERAMQRLLKQPAPRQRAAKDIVLPNSVVAAVSLIGLVVLSVVGCYVYYPPTSQVRKELGALQADLNSAVASKEWDTALFIIPQQKDWAHKLVVGRYLRREPWTRYQEMRQRVFLSKLEMLSHECEYHDFIEAKKWNEQSRIAYRRLSEALDEKE